MHPNVAVGRTYSLAYLTAAPLEPPDAIVLAAELGYHAVGLRALPVAPGGACAALIADRVLLAETKRRIADSGVIAFDMEIVRLNEQFDLGSLTPFLDVCGELGAKAVLVAGDDPDEGRLVQSFASFAAAAASYGLTADLEFMPWTAVSSCSIARRIVEQARQSNGRVLVDSLHAARSATTIADLAALPRELVSYVQICDAPADIPTTVDELMHTARRARLLPGDGGIDLAAMFETLPTDVPVSIELPNDDRKASLGVKEWARIALQSTRALLEQSTV